MCKNNELLGVIDLNYKKCEPKEATILKEEMTIEEKKLLKIVNRKLREAHLHLRVKNLNISPDGSISTEYGSAIRKWIKEDEQATIIVLEEITKYQAR